MAPNQRFRRHISAPCLKGIFEFFVCEPIGERFQIPGSVCTEIRKDVLSGLGLLRGKSLLPKPRKIRGLAGRSIASFLGLGICGREFYISRSFVHIEINCSLRALRWRKSQNEDQAISVPPPIPVTPMAKPIKRLMTISITAVTCSSRHHQCSRSEAPCFKANSIPSSASFPQQFCSSFISFAREAAS